LPQETVFTLRRVSVVLIALAGAVWSPSGNGRFGVDSPARILSIGQGEPVDHAGGADDHLLGRDSEDLGDAAAHLGGVRGPGTARRHTSVTGEHDHAPSCAAPVLLTPCGTADPT
jgi:hypothetical protein